MSMELQHVTHIYGEGTTFAKKALDDVNIKIEDGEFVGIIGHTGSGKSTLIQHFNGLLRPSDGKVLYRGNDIFAPDFPLRSMRGKVGLVFQYPEYQLFETSVIKDVAFGPKNQGLNEKEALERAKEALIMAGLNEEHWEKSPFELSGGQKRRAAIAGVLAMEPEILILDEPTAGLDPKGRNELFDQICQLREQKGMTIVLVSHCMEDVAEHVDRLIAMQKGRVLFDGTTRDVFTHVKELEEAELAVPEVTYLMRDLKARGIPVRTDVITLEEAEKEILRLC